MENEEPLTVCKASLQERCRSAGAFDFGAAGVRDVTHRCLRDSAPFSTSVLITPKISRGRRSGSRDNMKSAGAFAGTRNSPAMPAVSKPRRATWGWKPGSTGRHQGNHCPMSASLGERHHECHSKEVA